MFPRYRQSPSSPRLIYINGPTPTLHPLQPPGPATGPLSQHPDLQARPPPACPRNSNHIRTSQVAHRGPITAFRALQTRPCWFQRRKAVRSVHQLESFGSGTVINHAISRDELSDLRSRMQRAPCQRNGVLAPVDGGAPTSQLLRLLHHTPPPERRSNAQSR